MTEVRMAYLNFRDGGLSNGVFDFSWLTAAFEVLTGRPPDVIAICEGTRWGHDGGAGMHRACTTLDRLFGVPYVGEPGWHWRGPHGPAIIWNPITMRMDRWTGAAHESNFTHDRNIGRFVLRDEPEKRLNVLIRHYAFDSRRERIMEAERDIGYARDDVPTLLVGDLNSSASGRHLPRRVWHDMPAWKRPHKSRRTTWGRSVADTRPLDMLIGRPSLGHTVRSLLGGTPCPVRRVHGAGYHAVAELAYATGTPASEAFRGTDNPRGDLASLLISWLLANGPLAERFIADSYSVSVPVGRYPDTWPLDHRLIDASFDL